MVDTSKSASAIFGLSDYYPATNRAPEAIALLQSAVSQDRPIPGARSRLAFAIRVVRRHHEGESLGRRDREVGAAGRAGALDQGRTADARRAARRRAREREGGRARGTLVNPGRTSPWARYPRARGDVTAAGGVSGGLKLNPRAAAAQIEISRLRLNTGDAKASLDLPGPPPPLSPGTRKRGSASCATCWRPMTWPVPTRKSRRCSPRRRTWRPCTCSAACWRRPATIRRPLARRSKKPCHSTASRSKPGRPRRARSQRQEFRGGHQAGVGPGRSGQAGTRAAAAGRAHLHLGQRPRAAPSRRCGAPSTWTPACCRPAPCSAACISPRASSTRPARASTLADKRASPVGAPTMSGIILQAQGRTPEARSRYERALALDSRAAVAANNLAWLYAEAGENMDRAVKLAERRRSCCRTSRRSSTRSAGSITGTACPRSRCLPYARGGEGTEERQLPLSPRSRAAQGWRWRPGAAVAPASALAATELSRSRRRQAGALDAPGWSVEVTRARHGTIDILESRATSPSNDATTRLWTHERAAFSPAVLDIDTAQETERTVQAIKRAGNFPEGGAAWSWACRAASTVPRVRRSARAPSGRERVHGAADARARLARRVPLARQDADGAARSTLDGWSRSSRPILAAAGCYSARTRRSGMVFPECGGRLQITRSRCRRS